MKISTIKKPQDWPQNNREAHLTNILNVCEKFINEPSFYHKELLFSLIDTSDMNEINDIGLVRLTSYECAILNQLYYYASTTCCFDLKMYLYAHIARYTQQHVMLYKMNYLTGIQVDFYCEEYLSLIPPLKLFYVSYNNYHYDKKGSFCDALISQVKLLMKTTYPIDSLCSDFIMLFHELSYANSIAFTKEFCFNRTEIIKLFELEAQLIKLSNTNIMERPIYGVLKMTIKGWILKSRNNYRYGYLYKCISENNTNKAFLNQEIWMSKTDLLNDKREQKVINELFKNKQWLNFSWAKKTKIETLTDVFVCSFTKEVPDEKMKKRYGSCVFGYKSDRIANILSPIYEINGHNPMFDQVFCFDIIYDEQEAKDELNLVCQIIDLFNLSEKDKTLFFENLLKYWYFSFKDKKWEYEKERRYELFYFDYKNYRDLCIQDGFLKQKTTLYLYPDFLLTNNEKIHHQTGLRRMEKLNSISNNNFLFCKKCFQSDYSIWGDQIKEYICPICGSKDFDFIKVT